MESCHILPCLQMTNQDDWADGSPELAVLKVALACVGGTEKAVVILDSNLACYLVVR